MLHYIEVAFLPSATDCLSWSEDGELAIVAADHVHILVCLDFTEALQTAVDLQS